MEFFKVKNVANDEAELILYGDIVASEDWWLDDLFITPKSFLDQIEKLKNASTITIKINSYGGDVFVATAIYNQLMSLKAKKTVIIDGICASSATIIAMAGDVIKIPKNAFFMIHDPTIGAYGWLGVEELENMKELLIKCKQSIIEAYKTKTNLSDEKLSDLMSKTTWFVGEEAVQNGFCDEVITQDVVIQNSGKFCVINNLKVNPSNLEDLPINIKNIMNLATQKSVVEDKSNNNEGGREEMTIEKFKSDYPELYNQAYREGQENERGRIKAIEEISNGIDDDLLLKAKFEEPISAEKLAFENMKLENKVGEAYLKNQKDDLQNSNVNHVGAVPEEPNNKENTKMLKGDVGFLAGLMNKKRGAE